MNTASSLGNSDHILLTYSVRSLLMRMYVKIGLGMIILWGIIFSLGFIEGSRPSGWLSSLYAIVVFLGAASMMIGSYIGDFTIESATFRSNGVSVTGYFGTTQYSLSRMQSFSTHALSRRIGCLRLAFTGVPSFVLVPYPQDKEGEVLKIVQADYGLPRVAFTREKIQVIPSDASWSRRHPQAITVGFLFFVVAIFICGVLYVLGGGYVPSFINQMPCWFPSGKYLREAVSSICQE